MKEVLFEFIQQGKYIKVCAIDPETGLEAQIIGATAYPIEYIKLIAVKKLNKVIQKHQSSFFSQENKNKY